VTKLSIQWQIGNQCNFRCDYCHPDLYGGSNPFLDYDKFQTALTNLDQSVKNYKSVEIEFQGGEPTISTSIRNKIIDDDDRYRYVLTTNASADLEWWTKAASKFNGLTLAYHPMVDLNHFKEVVYLVADAKINFSIVANAHSDKDRWKQAVDVYNTFKGKYPIKLKALYSNYQKGNNKFFPYTEEQWKYYTEENYIEVPKASVEVQIQWVQDRLYNNYKGHLCWAGVDQVVIDYFGYVFRGWCKSHGTFGNVYDAPVVLNDTPKVCPKDICKNMFDQQVRKSENSWGFA